MMSCLWTAMSITENGFFNCRSKKRTKSNTGFHSIEVFARQIAFGNSKMSSIETARFDVAYFGDFLAVDTQHCDVAIALVKIGALVVGTGQDHGDRHIALRRDCESFRPIADHNAVDDAYGIEFEVDHAHRIDAAVRGAGAAVVGRERNLAAWRHCDIVGPLPGRQVKLGIVHLVAVDVEQRNLVSVEFGGERALAVW